MSLIKVVHATDLGNSLEIDNGYVEVKVSTEGNVTLSKTPAGLKADVTLPEVKKSVTGVAVDSGKLVLTYSDGETENVVLPAQSVDVKLQGAELTEENKLKLTLSNGDVIETDLARFVDAPRTALEYWTEIKALADFKATVVELLKSDEAKAVLLEVLKGDEVQNVAGQTKGYLLPAA